MLKRVEHIRFLVWFAALSFIFLSGCAKPPAKEIESAEKAVAEAKLKEADLYVMDVFSKAEDTLKKTKDYVAEKKYKEAKSSAEGALDLAQKAIAMIEPNKAKMKTQAEQLIVDVQNSLGELKSSIVKTRKKKDQIDREKIQGAIGGWEIDLVSVQEHLQTGKIRQAYDLLVSLQEQVKNHKEGMTAEMDAKAEKR